MPATLNTSLALLLLLPMMSSSASEIKNAISPLQAPTDLNPLKISLGKKLFSDPRLSSSNSISCSSCHSFQNGGAEKIVFSKGVGGQIGGINAPSVFNAQLNFRQFWNGRANSLIEQAEGPIHNPKEMASNWHEVLNKLSMDSPLQKDFLNAYGTKANRENILESIVEFEKSLITIDSPFDLYLKGEAKALTRQQISGYKKFQSFGCIACHQGAGIGGNMFQTLGIMGDYFKDRGGHFESDEGRYSVTKRERDRHVFKVPSLRNVALTAPYFHDGQVPTLEKAVKLMGHYQLGRDLSNDDITDLVAFLKSLTGKTPATVIEAGPNEK